MNLSLSALPALGKLTEKLDIPKISGIVSPIVAIIVSLVIVVFVVWPKFSDVLRLRTSNKELETKAVVLEGKAQKLQSYDKSELEEQLVAADQLLPSDKGAFTLVSQIERAAVASGVLLSSVSLVPGSIGDSSGQEQKTALSAQSAQPEPTTGVESESVPNLKVQVTVESDYKASLQFLSNLLALSRVVSLDALSIASSTSSNIININFTIYAYWQSLPLVLPSIESPIVDLTQEEIQRLDQVAKTGLIGVPIAIPPVPLGRSDLFAPF